MVPPCASATARLPWLVNSRASASISPRATPHSAAYSSSVLRLACSCSLASEEQTDSSGAWSAPSAFRPGTATRVRTISCAGSAWVCGRSEEHTSELQSQSNLVCRLLLEKKKKNTRQHRL